MVFVVALQQAMVLISRCPFTLQYESYVSDGLFGVLAFPALKPFVAVAAAAGQVIEPPRCSLTNASYRIA
jgi:hypothetical protein